MYYLWKGSSHEPAIGNEHIPGVGHQAPKTPTIAWKHTHTDLQLLALTALNCRSAWKTVCKGGKNAQSTLLSTPTVRSALEQHPQPTNTRVAVDGGRLWFFPGVTLQLYKTGDADRRACLLSKKT